MSSERQPTEASRPPSAADESVEALLRRLQRDSRRCRLAGLAAGGICLILVMATLCTVPGVVLGAGSGRVVGLYFPPFIGLAAIVGAGLLAVMGRSSSRLTRRLETLDDPCAVGPLAAHVMGLGAWPVGGVRQTLLRLVPRMHASELEALTPHERHCFTALLTSDELLYSGLLHGPDLKLAILALLEQHGDGRDVRAVRYLAYHAHHPEVADSARRCLERLEARAREQGPTTSLLRPVEGADDRTLLRPAEPAADTDPAALLRPAEKGEE